MTYLDGQEKYVVVQMYRGRAVGMSFPMDGNKHNDEWVTRFKGYGVTVNTYADGTLINIEVDLPESVTNLATDVA